VCERERNSKREREREKQSEIERGRGERKKHCCIRRGVKWIKSVFEGGRKEVRMEGHRQEKSP